MNYEITDFITIESISTYIGAVIATGIITQFFKDFWFFKNMKTMYFSFFVAFIVILVPGIIMAKISFEFLFLSIINAIAISLTSNGGYDFIVKYISARTEKKEEENWHRE